MKKLLAFVIFTYTSLAFAIGFTAGDQFTNQEVRGRLTVQCLTNGPGPTYGAANCRSEILNPGEYSYFEGPKTDADQVSLQATHEDGSKSKIKTVDYDGANGKSLKSFNLWIRTVLQRPLLAFGRNEVQYTLLKNGRETEQGTFIVNVIKGGVSVCSRIGFYTSHSANDCQMPETLCSRYFSENNYCQ